MPSPETPSDTSPLVPEQPRKPRRVPRRKAEADTSVSKTLATIYKANGTLPDLTTFERGEKRHGVRMLVYGSLVCALLGVVSWAGYFVFNPAKRFDESRIKLVVDGPIIAQSGTDVTLTLRYTNDYHLPLANAEVRVRLPEEFSLREATPQPTEERAFVWHVGTVNAGEGGTIALAGALHGATGSTPTVRATLTYRTANFNANFEKVTEFSFKLGESSLTAAVVALESATVGVEVPVTFVVRNKGETARAGVRIRLSLPEGFSLTKGAPSGGAEWTVETLKADAEWKVELSGIFGGTTLGEQTLGARVYELIDGKEYLQTEATHVFALSRPALELTLVALGASLSAGVTPGGTLPITVRFANKSERAIEGATLTLVVQAPSRDKKSLLDWAHFEDAHNGDVQGKQLSSTLRQGTITWNATHVPVFKEIPPGGEGLLDVVVPVKTFDVFGGQPKEGKIKLWAEATIPKTERIATPPITVLLLSDATIISSAEEVAPNGAPGQGAWRVQVVLTNTYHELSDLKLSVPLGDGIVWKGGAAPAGTIEFNEGTRTVQWTLGRLPLNVPRLELTFDLVRDAEGNTPVHALTEKGTFTAEDAVQNMTLSLETEAVGKP